MGDWFTWCKSWSSPNESSGISKCPFTDFFSSFIIHSPDEESSFMKCNVMFKKKKKKKIFPFLSHLFIRIRFSEAYLFIVISNSNSKSITFDFEGKLIGIANTLLVPDSHQESLFQFRFQPTTTTTTTTTQQLTFFFNYYYYFDKN